MAKLKLKILAKARYFNWDTLYTFYVNLTTSYTLQIKFTIPEIFIVVINFNRKLPKICCII